VEYLGMSSMEAPVETLEFMVLGEPTPEGSTRAFYIKKLDRTVTTHQNKKELGAWRNRVATEAQHALEGREWTSDSCSAYIVEVEFVLSRPASVPVHRRIHPIVKPDIDKLVRAINDALTGILFADDCQVVSLSVRKTYNDSRRAGAYIAVSRYGNQSKQCRRAKRTKKVQVEDEVDDPRDD
jgi:Holliday junction resolvase RusA-like endonuclease